MKRTLAIVLVVCFSVSLLAGCGGGDGSALRGKYLLSTYEIGGEDLMPLFGEMGLNANDFYIEFMSGGTFRMSMIDESGEGTFAVKGSKITLTIDGEDMAAKLNGNKVTLEEDGMKMVFTKK